MLFVVVVLSMLLDVGFGVGGGGCCAYCSVWCVRVCSIFVCARSVVVVVVAV